MTTRERVLVIGATQGTGLHIVERLLRDGYAVRVLARNPDRATMALRSEVEVVRGDVTQASTLAAAMPEVDHVILTSTRLRIRLLCPAFGVEREAAFQTSSAPAIATAITEQESEGSEQQRHRAAHGFASTCRTAPRLVEYDPHPNGAKHRSEGLPGESR